MTGEYYMYGHSLGAVIAFELAVQLMQSGAAAPKHIFVGARRAPHLSTRRAPLHTMDDDAFCTALLQYEGTRAEIFREPELRQLFLPILRADFQMVETYRTTGNDKLTIPITVFGGNRDPFVDQDELNAWRDLTSADCNVHRLDEGHFFSVSGFETIAGVLQTAAQSK